MPVADVGRRYEYWAIRSCLVAIIGDSLLPTTLSCGE